MATQDNKAVAIAAIKAAGWPQSEWATALAVATAESGLNPRAVNNKNSNGTSDYGLFQINSIHKPTAQEKVNPYANAKRAYKIWKDAGGKWTPWSAYNNGSYKASLLTGSNPLDGDPMFEAGKAAGETASGVVEAVTDPLKVAKAAVDSVLTKVTEYLNTFFVVLIGVCLVLIGLLILSRDRIGKVALSVATKGVSKHLKGGSTAVKAIKGTATTSKAVQGGKTAAKAVGKVVQ